MPGGRPVSLVTGAACSLLQPLGEVTMWATTVCHMGEWRASFETAVRLVRVPRQRLPNRFPGPRTVQEQCQKLATLHFRCARNGLVKLATLHFRIARKRCSYIQQEGGYNNKCSWHHRTKTINPPCAFGIGAL